MNKKVYFIDIDGVICTNTYGDYEKAEPIQKNIKKINKLFDEGHYIVLWTARGTKLVDKREKIHKLTLEQLQKWGVGYTHLEFGKPYYDFIIDDRAVKIDDI